MRFLPSSGEVEVAAYDLGGEGPDLLFAHATGFHGHVWLPMAERLRERFHCYAFDQRGHGRTRVPEGIDFAWEGLGDDILAVVDGLGLHHPLGVGHSAGGAALLMAEADRAGTFSSLYCYEPIVIPVDFPRPSENPLSNAASKRRDDFSSRDEAYAHYSSKPPLSSLAPEALRAYVDHGFADAEDGTVRLRCRPANEAMIYRMSLAHDTFSRLSGVGCPVTVACGALSEPFGPSLAERQAGAIPHGSSEVMAGLGHLGALEDPVALATSVSQAFSPRPG